MEPVQRRDADAGAAEVSIEGDVVTKVHRPGTDPHALTQRLRAAARSDCFLSPLESEPVSVNGLLCTRWPRIAVVRQDCAGLPWAAAGALLAGLHRESPGELSVREGSAARLARALAGPVADIVRDAARRIPAPAADRPTTLVHGDFHLGQLGWDGRWLLIDVDDLGLGDPATDLGRPAGFWAAGLIPDQDWRAFLDGYRDAGGPAVPDGDPWPVLEPYARAAVIAAAAHHPKDELLMAACSRMR